MALFKNMQHLPRPLRWLIVAVLKVMTVSLRLRWMDPNDELHAKTPRLYVIWHNRLLLLPTAVPGWRRKTLTFLASRSRDGGYIADILETFGMQAIRGSSSKGGAAALRQMQEVLSQGVSVCITPDGPRGPRYEVQDGVLWVAAKTGAAIVPAALNSKHHWELGTWDRLQIPRPFSYAEFVIGSPIQVGNDLTEATLPAYREQVREAMLAVCQWDQTPAEPVEAPSDVAADDSVVQP